MSKKWYNLFVSVDQPAGGEAADAQPAPAEPAPSAAQTIAEIARSLPAEPQFTAPVANPASFAEIYSSAGIQAPEHGYTILKVADMLQSEHLRGLPAEVRRSSILVALEAAAVKIQEVIEDAVKRDRALDTFERVMEKSLHDLEAAKAEENRQIQAEMERVVSEYRARLQANEEKVAKEREHFYGWRLQKQQEEKKIADAVGYFTTENPITTSTTTAQAAPPAKA